ncbi:AAA family ATPase [Lyngbya sp. PCC 8106]|uniref:AAA family ATPase n=1 Tax=Lyngbya sp. (strain PCC 8106) TaxID=313612 RepID=UPI0000EA9F9A|nr:AAA family ATPase [Lyngbya sp. PCC 8106]EAW38054.1 putative excinuclease ATPase subunit [Lyngbya sp. PCC 8106]
MRIKEISVKNLFGMFDHVIPMNLDERITIIHGPNGVGKTILLKILNSLFNSQYYFLHTISFTEFRLDFDDESYLVITKKQENKKIKKLSFSYYQVDSEVQTFTYPLRTDIDSLDFPVEIIDDIIPGLERIGTRKWLYLPTQETLNGSEIFERFGDSLFSVRFSNNRFNRLVKGQPEEDKWLSELKEKIKVGFIEAQRLFSFSSNRTPRSIARSMVPSVATYSQELSEQIQETLTEYGVLSQSLDRTFPVRVVNQKSSSNFTEDALRDQLSKLEEQRNQLIDLGLLEKDENPDFQVEQEIDDKTKSILSVYVEDVEKKLKVFSEISSKIAVFKKIAESRFSYKKMSITKEKGFTFTTLNGNPLSPTNLSSGEQHELVMLYELLFNVEPNSLILLDEPEISLHVAWQVEFINDLQDILKLANFDVLIATHSPDIINERWDLTVELKGPNK